MATSPPRRPSKLLWRKQYEIFRQQLLDARVARGLTQRAAAELMGRPHSFIAKSEAGERRVDAVELVQFAAVYRKPVSYFLPFARRTPR